MFRFLRCERHFSRCYGVLCFYESHDFHHFSPFSPSLFFTSSLSSSSSWCSGRFFFVLCCCRFFLCFCAVAASTAGALLLLLLSSLLVLLLLLLCCLWLLLVAVAARAAAVGAVGGSRVFLSGCFSFRAEFFCLFSLSFRPFLSSCQVHTSARRVPLARLNYCRDVLQRVGVFSDDTPAGAPRRF